MQRTTKEMIQMMEMQETDKFKNSKFLKFLKNVNEGTYQIEDGQLKKNGPGVEEEKD